VPLNYILLFAFTGCESMMVGYICSRYPARLVLAAAGLTTVATAALTLYACVTKEDFTMCGGFLFLMVISLFTVSLVAMFFPPSTTFMTLKCLGLVILYGLFLIHDTQLIAGGRRYELTLDDYVIGVIFLYIDIIKMFLKILVLLGRRKNN
jgi:protein lifeguard